MAGELNGYYCAEPDPEPTGTVCLVVQGSYSVPKAYVEPGTNNLWVFYRGQDGGFWSYDQYLWTQERTPDGTWHSEYSLGQISKSDVDGAQIPNTNEMQLFYRGEGEGYATNAVGNLMTQWYPN